MNAKKQRIFNSIRGHNVKAFMITYNAPNATAWLEEYKGRFFLYAKNPYFGLRPSRIDFDTEEAAMKFISRKGITLEG